MSSQRNRPERKTTPQKRKRVITPPQESVGRSSVEDAGPPPVPVVQERREEGQMVMVESDISIDESDISIDHTTSLTPAFKALLRKQQNSGVAGRAGNGTSELVASTPVGNTSPHTVDPLIRFRQLAEDSLRDGSASAAIFYADKAATLGRWFRDDVMLLAKAYVAAGQHQRAAHILEEQRLLSVEDEWGVRACLLAAKALATAGRHEQCLKLVETCLGEADSESEALRNSTKANTGGGATGGCNPLAALCCLRGRMYAEVDRQARAVTWLKLALAIDYKCIDALQTLLSRHLLSQPEQRDLLRSIQFSPVDENLKILYASLVGGGSEGSGSGTGGAVETLRTFDELDRRGLGDSANVLTSKADFLYHSYDSRSALDVCRSILRTDPHNLECMPVYLASLLDLQIKPQLFFTAHQLADQAPSSALAWHALGCYNLLLTRFEHAWKLFNKAAQAEPSNAIHWVGMGNAAAEQDDSDRAVGAYRAATRASAGSPQPPLYIGMEYLHTNNLGLAQHFLSLASKRSGSNSLEDDSDSCGDPLVLNELGVLAFRRGRHAQACTLFEKALKAASAVITSHGSGVGTAGAQWEPTLVNLGHCHRKLKRYGDAVAAFTRALVFKPNSAGTLAALGYTRHLQGRLEDAIMCYHQALGLKPSDPLMQQLLSRALKDSSTEEERTKSDAFIFQYKRKEKNTALQKALPAPMEMG